MIVLNGIQCDVGVLDFTASTHFLDLYGNNNFISYNSFLKGTGSTVRYLKGDQNIMDIPYHNLQGHNDTSTFPFQIKTATNHITVAGNLVIGAIYAQIELGNYNLTVNGTTTLSNSGNIWSVLSKTGPGNILFIGQVTNNSVFNFTGNPTVELRGGLNMPVSAAGASYFGTGLWSFTTNNQTLTIPTIGTLTWDAPILISGAITVTMECGDTIGRMIMNNYIDGNNASSTWVNKAKLYFNNASFYVPFATAGVFDYTTFSSSVVGYIFNGSITLPSTGYQGLTIGGTGTKTLAGNTTVSQQLIVGYPGFGTLQCSTHNLTVSGLTTLGGGGADAGILYKSGAGNILFVGKLSATAGASNLVDLSGGNPTVEWRGGYDFQNVGTMQTGTGLHTFSTNNQTIGSTIATQVVHAGNVLISGAITLTLSSAGWFKFLGTVDGNNASSTLDNRCVTEYQHATMPMTTGILQTDGGANTWKYNLAGNQAVKGGTYRTLELGGSGVKQLQGNVDWITAYSLTGTATVDLNGFTLS